MDLAEAEDEDLSAAEEEADFIANEGDDSGDLLGDEGAESMADSKENFNEGEEVSDKRESIDMAESGGEGPEDIVASNDSMGQAEEDFISDSGSEDDSFNDFGGENQESVEEPMTPTQQKSWVPVKKVVQAPFYRGGVLINAVYLVRPGDDLASVSQKIYNTESRRDELLKANPTFTRGIKTGDKVYYNSPQRSTDDSMLSLYYEEMGLEPKVYRSSGENIRVLSQKLLGDEDSWKEVWATNMHVDSKGEIPAGTELKYWPEGFISNKTSAPPSSWSQDHVEVAETDSLGGEMDMPESSDVVVAEDNSDPAMPPEAADYVVQEAPVDDFAASNPPPPGMANQEPPPSNMDMARNDPPAAPGTQAGAAMDAPPPPPVSGQAPSDPRGGAAAKKAESGSMQWMMGIGLLLVAVVLVFIIIRKRRKSSITLNSDFDFNTAISTVGPLENLQVKEKKHQDKRAI